MNNLIAICRGSVTLLLYLYLGWAVFLGLATLVGQPFTERFLRRTMIALGWLGLVLGGVLVTCVFLLSYYGVEEIHQFLLHVNWFQVGRYHYEASLIVSFPACFYAALSSFLFICIATFSGNYLHRDSNYQRFMMLVAFAQIGVLIICFATSGDLTFLGWELVGLCSILLINFFQNHAAAAKQSLRAMINYRIADAFLIFAMLLMHDRYGHSDFFPKIPMFLERTPTDYWIGAFLILGSLGKAGQFPFHTWLARAMEGPTPSSALFYGALSVHLGPLLLIKTEAYWSWSFGLKVLIAALGIVTALLCRLTGRATGNVKGQLAYAVMSQIGLIYIELALGYYKLALLHMIGHALLRTWQYLRSSALLRDVQEHKVIYELIQLRGSRTYPASFAKWNRWLYCHAVQGFHFEEMYHTLLVRPLLWLSRRLNFIEARKGTT